MNLYGKIIVIKRNGTDGAHFPLTVNCCLFGRSLDCDIRIQLPSVDLSQCQIEIDAVGHVFIKDLSKLAPTLVNSKALSKTLTALSHRDIITIVDRQFRFEYPPGSRFFPAKSPKMKSPKTPSSGKAVGNMSPRPVTPLSPRTDNVPSSSQTGKVSKSPVSAKKELNVNNNRISKQPADLASPSNLLFSISPASVKKSLTSHTPVTKARLSAASSPDSPGIKVKSLVKPNAGSPYPKGGSNLRKSITDLRRRSMPVFEIDEAASPNFVISKSQKKITPVAQNKRKSPGFTVPASKRKRVSFGPSLSPEHFDKNLPPKTPVKKGATPSVNETSLITSLVKGKTTPSKARSPSPAKKGTPGRPRSISPKKNVTPAKSKSLSPAKPQSPSPAKKGSPGRPRSISPKKIVTPVQSKSPMPTKNVTPAISTPAKPESPSSAKKGTPGRPRSVSPVKTATPAKLKSQSSAKKSTPGKPESPSSAKKGTPGRPRSASPVKSATSAKSLSPSPKKATPGRPKSASPAKAATPAKSSSPSLAKKGTPGRPRSVSPVKTATPAKLKSQSSAKKSTPGKPESQSSAKKGTPGRPRSVSPVKAVTPVNYLSPSPVKKATPAKLKGQSSAKKATPGRPRSVSPAKSLSPSPAKKGTPGRPRSISPRKNDTPAKSKTPSTAKKSVPSTPSSLKKATPGRPRSLTPTKIDTPAKSRSPSSSKKGGSPKGVPMSPDIDLFSQLTPLKPQQSKASIEETPKSSGKLLGKGSFKKALMSDATISPSGLKRLMKTPIPDTVLSPTGIKRLMKTPKTNNSPIELKKLFKTPKPDVSLSPAALGRLMKTPKTKTPAKKATPGRPRSVSPAKSSNQSPAKEATPTKQMSTSAKKVTPGRPRSVSPAKPATPAKSLSTSPDKKKNSPKVIKSVQINAPSPLGSVRHIKTPVVKRAGHHAKSPIALNLQSPSGKLAIASSLAGLIPKQKSVIKTPTSQSPTISRPQSLKSGRTPKVKKIFEFSPEPKASTPKIGRKSLGESSKSGLKEKIARFASPGEKIIAPPQDINKVVALRAIHGITPKLAILQKAAGMTPKSGKKGQVSTPKSRKKDNVKTPESKKKGLTPKSTKKGLTPKSTKKGLTPKSVKKPTVKTWADVVKTGVPARQPSSLASRKKTPKKVVKKTTVKTKKYISSSPSTSQFGSPATVFIGRKALGKTKFKTPKPLPRKGRKKSMGKARKSMGNVSYSGVEEMFNSPEQPSSPQLSESALYAEVPDTPSGPNEMIVSPLSGSRSKSSGSRKSVKLTGVKELFSEDKIGTEVSMLGVRELYQKLKTPNVNLIGVRELMRTPKAVQGASPSGVQQLFATPESAVPNTKSSVVNSSGKQSLPVAKTPKTSGKGGRGQKRKIDEAIDALNSKKAGVEVLDSPSRVAKKSPVKKVIAIKSVSPVKQVSESPQKTIAAIITSPSPVKPRATRRGVAKKSPVKKVIAIKSVSPVKQVSESPQKTIAAIITSPSPVKPRATRRGVAKKSPVKKVIAAKSVSPVKQVSESPEKIITAVITSPSPVKPRATRRGAAAKKSPVKKSTVPAKQKGTKPTPKVDLKLISEPVKSPVVQARRGRKTKEEKTTTQVITPSPAKPKTTRRGVVKEAPKKATPVKKTRTKAVPISEPVNNTQLPEKQSARRGRKGEEDPKPAPSRKRKAELESVSEPTVKSPVKRARRGAPAPSPKKAQIVPVKSPAVKARRGRKMESPVKAVSPQVANKSRGKKEKSIAQPPNEESANKVISPSPAKPRTTRRGAAAKQTPKKATPIKKTKAVTFSGPVNDTQLPTKQSTKRGQGDLKPQSPKPAPSQKRKAELESVSEPTVKSPVKRAKRGAPAVTSEPSPKTLPTTSKGTKRVQKTAESPKVKASPKSTRSKKVAQKPTIKSKSPKKPVKKDTSKKSPVQLAPRTRRTRAT